MITRRDIRELRDLCGRSTPGEWHAGHLADDDIACNCCAIVDEIHAGGVATIHVDNGIKSLADGGNACPPRDEAVANMLLIVRMKNILPALLDHIEGSWNEDEATDQEALQRG